MEQKDYLVIIAKKFSNLRRKMDIQINESQKIPNRVNSNKSTTEHIMKLSKVTGKERILKEGREN